MPELPEVETMARDLAPLVEGATIDDAWWDWAPVIRHPGPETFRRRIRGRRVVRVGRRAKWLVFDLSGSLVLAVQVKMTGQLFVLPEGTAHDKHVHLRLTLDGGPVAGGGVVEGPRWLLPPPCSPARCPSPGVRRPSRHPPLSTSPTSCAPRSRLRSTTTKTCRALPSACSPRASA